MDDNFTGKNDNQVENQNKKPSMTEIMFGKEFKVGCAFLAIFLIYNCLPYVDGMTEDSKKTKAKQDCDMLCQAIQKYNSIEGSFVTSQDMMELQRKYVTNLNNIKDPWGNKYEHSRLKGRVYSKGRDGKHDSVDPRAACNKDDVSEVYNNER